MPEAKHGQWFEFEDLNGRGCCQTDLLFGQGGVCWVLEVKYSWTVEGHRQLEELYLPVVSKAIARPTRGLVVCRRLTEGMRGVRVASGLQEAILLAETERRVAWHWLGQSAPQLKTGGLTRARSGREWKTNQCLEHTT